MFSVPFFVIDLFVLDWLHIVDVGVALGFLGLIFKMLLRHQRGTNQNSRVQEFYKQIVHYYDRYGVESRLDNLTMTMLGKAGKPPKLRAKAAEARGLITFAREQAVLHFSDVDPMQSAAKQAAIHLDACKFCLHADTYDASVIAEHCKKF